MKILFLSRWFPYPADNGSKLRIYNLLRGLNQHHDVTLFSFADQSNRNLNAPEVRSLCSEAYVVPWKEFNPKSWQARLGILSLTPRSIIDTFSKEMSQTISQRLQDADYDLVIASQLAMAAYYPCFQNVPALLEELELGLFYDQAFSPDGKIRLRHALTWFKLRLYLSKLLKSFEVCTLASYQERQLLLQNFPRYKKHVEVIPNCLNYEEYENVQVEKKQNTLIFTGSFRYHTNFEAMVWFVLNIFPLILEQIPDTSLIITGDHANLSLPFTKNVTLAGYVDDIKSMIASSTVSIAPLLSGGGTRLKILEAMAVGTPVVATSKGAEGLDAYAGEHLLIADSPEDFAQAVVNLLLERRTSQKLIVNAKQLVREKYNWAAIMPAFLDLITQVSQEA